MLSRLLEYTGLLHRPRSVDDPFFGHLDFCSDGASGGLTGIEVTGHWECDIDFSPTGKKLKLYFVDAGDGISVEQIELFKEFEKRYAELESKINPLLIAAHEQSLGPGSAKNVKFACSAVTLPSKKEFENGQISWTIYFSYEEGEPDSSVEMNGWEIEECYSGH